MTSRTSYGLRACWKKNETQHILPTLKHTLVSLFNILHFNESVQNGKKMYRIRDEHTNDTDSDKFS